MLINRAILIFTTMSSFLDRIKVAYVVLLGFIVPIGMKLVSLTHGVSESQTFEMLTGSVGVAFMLTGLCLGLAGTMTGGGRGEFLPLLFTRPLTRAEYVITKWVTITLICGVLAAVQNVIVAGLGIWFGEQWTPVILLSQLLERFLDAAIFSAAFILTMLVRQWFFQMLAIIAFYVWLMGQTLPPVSVAGQTPGNTDAASVGATQILLQSSQWVGDFVLPTLHVYDALNAPQFPWLAVASYVSTLTIYLACAVAVTNRRDFFYGTN